MKGHKDLGTRLTGQSLRTIGKRHALKDAVERGMKETVYLSEKDSEEENRLG